MNVKTQIQSKVAEVKQQLRQMLRSQQHEFSLAGIDGRYIEDTGTVGRNTTTPSPKPSNTQPSQNGSNKKPTEDKGTGNSRLPVLGKNDADPFIYIYMVQVVSHILKNGKVLLRKQRKRGQK